MREAVCMEQARWVFADVLRLGCIERTNQGVSGTRKQLMDW